MSADIPRRGPQAVLLRIDVEARSREGLVQEIPPPFQIERGGTQKDGGSLHADIVTGESGNGKNSKADDAARDSVIGVCSPIGIHSVRHINVPMVVSAIITRTDLPPEPLFDTM